MDDQNTTEYSQQDLKYVLDKLYKCRDIEISNLWQRSVFLSVFLILLFTAYGYLMVGILEKEIITLRTVLISLVSIVISGLGIIFSVIWILMSKSSKAWYEVYEHAISSFENEYCDKLGLPPEYIMGEMSAVKIKNSIISTSAGAYSPSRINIAIGQICFFLWITVMIFHVFFNIYNYNITENICLFIGCTIFLPLLFIAINIFIVKAGGVRSSFLDNKKS